MELVDFLLARIAEDEVLARSAAAGPWTYGKIESVAGGSLYDAGVMIASIRWDNVGENPEPIHRFRSEQQADATGEHIARHDPARVLAECEAKRRIVETVSGVGYNDVTIAAVPVLATLALPYADHPDYDPTWRP